MRSHFLKTLNKKLLALVDGHSADMAQLLMNDEEVQHLQDYANNVSITRLNFNDHGPVHMRKVTINAMVMAKLLKQAGIKLNLEREKLGTHDEARCAVLLAAFLHDIGMSVARDGHEVSSGIIGMPIIKRLLESVFPDDIGKRTNLRSLALEGILGHMATQRIHSLEAGLVLVADGCDMEKGRARIPMLISSHSRVGDIHKYASSAITAVKIETGSVKPIRITITMKATVGFFQVEEVLIPKIAISPAKAYIELYAGVTGQELKCYME